MPKRQRLLSVDASKHDNCIELATLQFLARRTQGLSDAEFILMLRRLAQAAADVALGAERAFAKGEEL